MDCRDNDVSSEPSAVDEGVRIVLVKLANINSHANLFSYQKQCENFTIIHLYIQR